MQIDCQGDKYRSGNPDPPLRALQQREQSFVTVRISIRTLPSLDQLLSNSEHSRPNTKREPISAKSRIKHRLALALDLIVNTSWV